MASYVVGLTGGIGSGKSAVSACFENFGVHVADTDQASRAVVEPGSEALREIVAHFGPAVLSADGRLDRAQLRAAVFKAPEERRWLEQLINPKIAAHVSQRLAEAPPPYALLVNPVLIETGHYRVVQRVLVVDTPEALQLSRTMDRDGNSEQQVRAIMAAQTDRATRLAAADDVIINDGPLAALTSKVEALHERYVALAAKSAHGGAAIPVRE